MDGKKTPTLTKGNNGNMFIKWGVVKYFYGRARMCTSRPRAM